MEKREKRAWKDTFDERGLRSRRVEVGREVGREGGREGEEEEGVRGVPAQRATYRDGHV
jgi:hypothetical protein